MKTTSLRIMSGFTIIIAVFGIIVAVMLNTKTDEAPVKNLNVANNTPTVSNTPVNEEPASITLSQKRTNARSIYYETDVNSERCAVMDLNDYIPTKNIEAKTYEWIIEFPNDDCVRQQSATNLPESLGKTESEYITGTTYRKTTVSYE